MALEKAHILKADQNKTFLASIGDEFPDWLATVAFYRGVHLVEACFARKNIHSQRHSERNDRLKRDYPKLWMEFKPLYEASRMVRYTERCISTREAREQLIAKRLPALEALVNAQLDSPPTKA